MADKAIEYWERAVQNLAPSTQRAYQSDFNQFLTFIGMKAEEFYQFAHRVTNSPDRRDRSELKHIIQNYNRYLENQGYASGTIRNKKKPILSFLQANEVEIDLKKINKSKQVSSGQYVIRRDQIRQLFSSVGKEFRLRNRALMMFLKDSGVRVSDASRLKVDDYRGAKTLKNETGEEFRVFSAFKTQKTDHYAFIHIGPEAIKAINDYLKDREALGFISPDEFLFAGRDSEPISSTAITSLFYRLCEPLRRKGDKVSAHSFRKYHRTQLEGAGINSNWIKRLQGKAADTYSHPEQNGALTEHYIQAYDNIRVFDTESLRDLQRDEKIADLEARIEEQHKKIVGREERIKDLEKENLTYLLKVQNLEAKMEENITSLQTQFEKSKEEMRRQYGPTISNLVELGNIMRGMQAVSKKPISLDEIITILKNKELNKNNE